MASTGRARMVPRVGTIVASQANSAVLSSTAPTYAGGNVGRNDPVTAYAKGIRVAAATAAPIVHPSTTSSERLDPHHPAHLQPGSADELEECVLPASVPRIASISVLITAKAANAMTIPSNR